MFNIDFIIRRIRRFAKKENLSAYELSRLSGAKESTVRKMKNADWNPTAKTIRKLEAVIPDEFE